MAKPKLKTSTALTAREGYPCEPAKGQGTNYSPPELWSRKPDGTQFAPTESAPISRRQQMAGVS